MSEINTADIRERYAGRGPYVIHELCDALDAARSELVAYRVNHPALMAKLDERTERMAKAEAALTRVRTEILALHEEDERGKFGTCLADPCPVCTIMERLETLRLYIDDPEMFENTLDNEGTQGAD